MCLSFPSRRHVCTGRRVSPGGGGLLPSPLSPACSASRHRESKKREQRGPCEHHRRPSCSVFSKPRHNHALTLNVCFLLMLSEGCTAATRKLRRGMLPRMLSSFSSGGQMQRLRVRRGLEPRLPPGRDPRAAAGTRAHRSLPVGEQADRPPVGNRCLPVAPRQLFVALLGSNNSLLNYSCPPSAAAARAEPSELPGRLGKAPALTPRVPGGPNTRTKGCCARPPLPSGLSPPDPLCPCWQNPLQAC